MLFRRLTTALLFLAVSAGLTLHAIETVETTKKHPAPKPAKTSTKTAATASDEPKRAPMAKPFKTTRSHKSKHSKIHQVHLNQVRLNQVRLTQSSPSYPHRH